jgi:3-methyl-2-oxobutanoate hydroxymethyltransferase
MKENDTPSSRPVTIADFKNARQEGRRIAMITAYDTPSARLADSAGVDAILVGDSIGRNVLGMPDELPVTMDDMVRATQSVVRGTKRAMVIADMPFGSYQCGEDEAVTNAVRLVKEGGAHAVKLEGAGRVIDVIERLVDAGIPVMGHVGFTPQSVHALGGPRVQGRDRETAQNVLDGARRLQSAGAFAVVLELVPISLAGLITNSISIPTIGIGSGPACDGQVQIWHDVLGLSEHLYRHVRRYADLNTIIREALSNYVLDVSSAQFPTHEHAVRIEHTVLEGLDADERYPDNKRSEPLDEGGPSDD